jgi:predicted nuclease of restriction endonuclease-like (RecB) superfamily
VLAGLAEALTAEFGRGFSKRNLELMRKFYLTYSIRSSHTEPAWPSLKSIAQTPSAQLAPDTIAMIAQSPSAQSTDFFLSWSHYVLLMGLENGDERSFYEIEATRQNWNLRILKRQIDSCLYERLALSTDKGKGKVRNLAHHGDQPVTPRQLVRDPLVLEFLGLEEQAHYSEHDLESAVIDKFEHFFLELGKGFLFEARQKRFTFGADHFFVDLVFLQPALALLRAYRPENRQAHPSGLGSNADVRQLF